MANTSEVQGHMLIRSRMGVSVDGFVATPDGLPAWREVPGSRACQVSELGHVGRVTSARSAVGQLSRQAGGLGGQVVLLAEVRGAGRRECSGWWSPSRSLRPSSSARPAAGPCAMAAATALLRVTIGLPVIRSRRPYRDTISDQLVSA